MTRYELLPADATAFDPTTHPLRWGRTTGGTGSVVSSLDWDLHTLGPVSVAAADLLRICAGAYLADRLTRRGIAFTRSIELIVHVADRTPWTDEVLDQLANLLCWLTGDAWTIDLVPAATAGSLSAKTMPALEEVVLLSGGLDSLCGAVERLADRTSRLFLSHADGTTAVQRSQRLVREWLAEAANPARREHLAVTFAQGAEKKEASSRSRSLLFASLAVATAAGRGAGRVVVPENGYTSINPPLTTSRGGALSTRSTHPTTFARINRLLQSVGISVEVGNPYQALTKGELVAQAASRIDGEGFAKIAAETLSCGKLDGTYYKGGNPNYNCGLCVPCLVRRGSMITAGISDRTPYLVDTLPQDSLPQLISNRRDDTLAAQEAAISGISEDDLLACGPWPDEFEIDEAVALCAQGLEEVARVPLP